MGQVRLTRVHSCIRIALVCVPGLLTPSVSHAKQDRSVCVEVILRSPKSPEQSPEAQAPPASMPASMPASEPTEPGVDDARVAAGGEGSHGPSALAPADHGKKHIAKKAEETRVDHSLLPLGQTPADYLKRLFEHFVTHQDGYVAAESGCQEQIRVELYPLREGWTAFTRYSGHGREERVDRLFADELSQFAERAVLALLGNKPISSTIMRDTVLRADSKRAVQRIRGTHHFLLELGTQVRGGSVPTAGSGGAAADEIRIFSPMTLAAGYRARFENWGIETMSHLGINTSKTSIRDNPLGGHVDLGGLWGVNLHFLLYTNPRGITSFYLGSGSTFELLWLTVIRPEGSRGDDSRSVLFSGGLTVDALCGFEFMRASTVQFVLQAELNLPAYEAHSEEAAGGIRTWLPGLSVKLGMMF